MHLMIYREGLSNSNINDKILFSLNAIITSMINLLLRFLVLSITSHNAAPLLSNCAMDLALSGTSTIITFPNSSVSAIVLTNQPRTLAAIPNSKWIWNSQATSSLCDMSIRVSHNFTIKCLNQPIRLDMTSDNLFNF
jgi:hypothetical protein